MSHYLSNSLLLECQLTDIYLLELHRSYEVWMSAAEVLDGIIMCYINKAE